MEVIAFAHRGGAGVPANIGIENTVAAFGNAHDLGYRHFETDVRVSCDAVPYAFHDPDLARLCGRAGQFADLTSAEADRLLVGGREAPPRLDRLLTEFPDVTFTIDIKTPDALEPTMAVVEAQDAFGRCCFGSFDARTVTAIRRRHPQATTSASTWEVAAFVLLPTGVLKRRRWSPAALQVPLRFAALPVLTRRFVRRGHAAGLTVHAWTVDDAPTMRQLIDWGVDGLMTDRTDTLRSVLIERGLWP